LQFCLFQKSQGEHNKLDYLFFSFLGSITCEVSMFKTWCKLIMFQKFFCMFKIVMDNIYFFKLFFFVIKCAPFPLKIGEDINIDGWKKHLKLVKFILKHIWALCFKHAFEFWNYELKKKCLEQKLFICLLFKTWMHNINGIDQNVVKKEVYLTHSYKLGMKYARFRKID
jgi:hypothetical protein